MGGGSGDIPADATKPRDPLVECRAGKLGTARDAGNWPSQHRHILFMAETTTLCVCVCVGGARVGVGDRGSQALGWGTREADRRWEGELDREDSEGGSTWGRYRQVSRLRISSLTASPALPLPVVTRRT